jgi:catalase
MDDELVKTPNQRIAPEETGEKYRSMSTIEQDRLIDNIIDSLGKANKLIQERMVGYFTQADSELGMRVAKGMSL